MRLYAGLALCSIAVAAAGCTDDGGTELVSLELRPPTAIVEVGEQLDLEAIGHRADGAELDLTGTARWTSDDPAVAELLESGVLEGRAEGRVEVRADVLGLVATARVDVVEPAPDRIEITPDSATLLVGEQVALQALAWRGEQSEDVTASAAWSSEDDDVATVVGGLVTARAAGQTRIWAGLGERMTLAVVQVRAPGVVSLELNPSPVILQVGETVDVEATATFEDGTTALVTSGLAWRSLLPRVATVSDDLQTTGRVTGVAVGETTVEALDPASEVRARVTVRVTEARIISLAVMPRTATIAAGEQASFSALATLSDGRTRDATAEVTWTSSDPSVAVASTPAGTFRGVAAGEVSVSVEDPASGATSAGADGNLTVTPPALRGITIQPRTATVDAGDAVAFAAIGQLSDGTSEVLAGVQWSSSRTSVATIDAAGMAVGLAAGQATISARDPATGVESAAGSATLSVSPATLVSLAVTPSPVTLIEDNQQAMTATGLFSDGSTRDVSGAVTWQSSSPAATVDPSGVVTAVSPGISSITAIETTTGIRSSDSGQSATVTVIPRVLLSLAVSPRAPRLPVGAQAQLTAEATYNDQSVADVTAAVTWSSAAAGVASVGTSGNLTGVAEALAAGSAAISALDPASGVSSDASNASATVTVTATVTLVSLAVTSPTPTLTAGASTQLEALGTFSDGGVYAMTNRVTWASSAPGVAAVSNSPGTRGRLTGVAPGATVVSATYAPTGVQSGPGPTITVAVPTPTLVRGADTPQFGNLSGGVAFDDACAPGEALIGVHAQVAGWLQRVGGRCGALTVQPNGSGGLSVAVSPGTTLPERGAATGTAQAATCPAPEVMVGFTSRTGTLVDRIEIQCAPLVVTAAGPGAWSVTVGPTTTRGAVGGTGGNLNPTTSCPSGQVATVARIRAGNSVDAFGVGCSGVTIP